MIAWLIELAGADLIQHQVVKIEQAQNGFIIDDAYQGNYLVGAGGTHCPVRKQLFRQPSENREKGLILAKEAEFNYPVSETRCHLWFFEDRLPGYAWYVPKADGVLNIGIGASASGLQRRGRTLNGYWEQHLDRLAKMELLGDAAVAPSGHSYLLNQSPQPQQSGRVFLVGDSLGLATHDMGEGIGPALQSGILAAEAIQTRSSLDTRPIPRLSFPSLFGWRK